jgi:hypothetical protein
VNAAEVRLVEQVAEAPNHGRPRGDSITFEETCWLGYRKATLVRIVVARAKDKVEGRRGTELVTAGRPQEVYEWGLLASSKNAHVLVKKVRFGMPFQRLAEELASSMALS